MQIALNILIVLAVLSVVFVLGWGLFNMVRGGDGNLSQKLMRARVILQAVALGLLFLAIALFAPKG